MTAIRYPTALCKEALGDLLAEFLSPWAIIQGMLQDSVPVQHLAVPALSTAHRNASVVHRKQWELTELHWGRKERQIFVFATCATSAQQFEAFSLQTFPQAAPGMAVSLTYFMKVLSLGFFS